MGIGGNEVEENREDVDDTVVDSREIVGRVEVSRGSVESSGCGSGRSA